jgi:hypothetical protein
MIQINIMTNRVIRNVIWFNLIFLLVLNSCNLHEQSDAIPKPKLLSTSIVSRIPVVPSATYFVDHLTKTQLPVSKQDTITPSPTPVLPTLDAKQRVGNIKQALETNQGCKLPCLWGITPGKSNWLETKNFFDYLGLQDHPIPLDTTPSVSILHGYAYSDSEGYDPITQHQTNIYNKIFLFEKSSIIEKVLFTSDGFNNPDYFISMWTNLMPRKILADYGEPSRVQISTLYTLMGDRHSYDLRLIYDHNGFIIQYTGLLEMSGNNFQICLSDDGKNIRTLAAYSQIMNDLAPLEDMGNMKAASSKRYKSIQDATGITVNEFYKKFTQTNERACLLSPRDVWK